MERRKEYIKHLKAFPYVIYYKNERNNLVKSCFPTKHDLEKYIESNIDNMVIDAIYLKGKQVYPKIIFKKINLLDRVEV